MVLLSLKFILEKIIAVIAYKQWRTTGWEWGKPTSPCAEKIRRKGLKGAGEREKNRRKMGKR